LTPSEPDDAGGLHLDDTVAAQRFAEGQRALLPAMRALMRATGAEVDVAIDDALARIGAFCVADRSYVFRFSEGGARLDNTHEWCMTGVEPQIDLLKGLPRSIADTWMPALENDRAMIVEDVAAIPDAALREVLKEQEILALVVVPMIDAGTLTGFVGLDIVRARAPFDVVEIGLLRILGDAIGAALARRDAAAAARRAQAHASLAEEEVHRLARVAEVSTNLIILLDTELRITWANRAFETQSGYRLDDIVGRDFSALVRGPDSDAETDAAVRRAIATRSSFEGETVNHDANGDPYWIQFNIHPLFDKAGQYIGYVSIETVVSERKALEEEIAQRNAFLSAVLQTSRSAIVAMDDADRVVYANPAAKRILALVPDPTVAGTFQKPDWTPLTRCSPFAAPGSGDGAATDPIDLTEMRDRRLALQRQDGADQILSVNAATLSPPVDGAKIVLSVNDVTEAEQSAERLRRLAEEDPLTGLANRRGLAAALDAALAPADASPPPFALIMLDLDHFKLVNDSLRHETGDAVLREVARRLTRAVRPGDCVARVGGDEFLILSHGLQAEAAVTQAERLRARVAHPVRVDGQVIHLTATAGFALFPEHGRERARLMTGADVALHAAKRAGRNRTEILSPALHAAETRRHAILKALAAQDLEDELSLVVQPQVRTDADLGIAGAEVLLRWSDPILGAVSAAEFVPIAEDAGLIARIDSLVMDLAIAQLARWTAMGWAYPLSVNVSSRTLAEPGFGARLLSRLAAAGVDPHLLIVELTETAPITMSSVVQESVKRMRNGGIGLAIDDFGTGYASLASLQQIDASEVKIDRDFVACLDASDRACNRELIRAIIAVARALNLSITAEGVETETQFDWLVREGCDRVQGFFTGAPMSADAFERDHVRSGPRGRRLGQR
jgi:diguanylate cyclase (GGDEF)-like protein/PAS domain S-box-containing protein